MVWKIGTPLECLVEVLCFPVEVNFIIPRRSFAFHRH